MRPRTKRLKDLLTCQVSDLRGPHDTLIDPGTLHGAHEVHERYVIVQDLWVTLVLAYAISGGVFVVCTRHSSTSRSPMIFVRKSNLQLKGKGGHVQIAQHEMDRCYSECAR